MIEKMRKDLMMPKIKVCTPPAIHKDWNDAYKEGFDLKSYVKNTTKDYDLGYLINANIESW